MGSATAIAMVIAMEIMKVKVLAIVIGQKI